MIDNNKHDVGWGRQLSGEHEASAEVGASTSDSKDYQDPPEASAEESPTLSELGALPGTPAYNTIMRVLMQPAHVAYAITLYSRSFYSMVDDGMLADVFGEDKRAYMTNLYNVRCGKDISVFWNKLDMNNQHKLATYLLHEVGT